MRASRSAPVRSWRGNAALAVAAASVGATLVVAGPAAAQSDRVVRGVVRSADGAPVADARVTVAGAAAAAGALTSPGGAFALRVPVRGDVRLAAARLGFAPETLAVPRDRAWVAFRLAAAPLVLDPAVVRAERTYSAASSAEVRRLDVALRPRESSQELLRLVPGLVIAQHAGGGKAEQIFLRGFDADHGTDVAVSVDGTPVNMASHAHGQGYADLHFLMPEVIERVEVRKGPYDARDGDFATAGAVTFRTRDRIGRTSAVVRGGSFGAGHAAALLPLGGDVERAGGYLAGSAHRADGPFDRPQGYRRLNGFAKWTMPVGAGAEAAASAFDARWSASGQLPQRAVRDGRVGRFGAIDPTEGGATSRYDVSAALRSRAGGEQGWEARAYATRYRLDLFSNFTFYAADSANGDGIEQVDDRTVLGATAAYGAPASILGRAGGWRVGAGVRTDDARVALHHQRARARLGTRSLARVELRHLYTWARYEVQLAERVRLDVGLRADAFRSAAASLLATVADSGGAGARWAGLASPKANLAFELSPSTTLFANAGSGFHSNDARDVAAGGGRDRVLPRAVGAEAGVRHGGRWGSVAAALWGLDLQSELVYAGDEGVTEPSGRTRRVGVDVEGRLRVARRLWADADLNLARGRFRDAPPGADRIPLAPTRTATAGLTVRDAGPFEGGARVRHASSRPATEDGAVRARGYTVAELFGAWTVARVRLTLAVDNLFDTAWNEAQFATTSRLPGEAAPVTELHFTPGAPRGVQAGVEYRF